MTRFKHYDAYVNHSKKLNKNIGDLGERLAIRKLERKGYKLLEKNDKTRFGEVDLVMLDKSTLVFVEVKTRLSSRYGWPEEAINYKKLKQISFSSSLLYNKYKTFKKCRVDAICIELTLYPMRVSRLTHYVNVTA